MNIKIILYTSAPKGKGFKCFTSKNSFFLQQTQCNDRKSPLDVRLEQHFMM